MISRLLSNPTIGKTIFGVMKSRVFKPYSTSVEAALEEQERMLSRKFSRMEGTTIGSKIGVRRRMKLEELPVTDYSFYEGFFRNCPADAFMYPIDEYERVRTSGISGSEKWFMIPRLSFVKCLKTGLATLMAMFHDGEKITFNYGDIIFVNVAPRPFSGGYVLSNLEPETYGIIRLVPNINLRFKDKVKFFIRNHKKVDGAVMLASTLISCVMHEIEGRVKLKGLLTLDSQIAEMYRDEIEDFTGIPARTIYATTETLNCTVPSVQHTLGFFFDWRRGIFEFLPVEKGVSREVTSENLVPLNEVKVGEAYRPVFTSLEGEMTRYVINDSLLCVAKGDDILGTDFPVFRFHSRLETTISLQNFTRISEEELLVSLKHSDVRFVDFTARVEVENGLECLAIYLEHTGNMSVEEIKGYIHNHLYETDKDYRDLVDFFDYVPIRIRFVKKGAFSRYMEKKGTSWGKVERINMEEEVFKKTIADG